LSGLAAAGYYGSENQPMTDDAELLRRFVEEHSNADFTEFVGRHFNIVYHAALRRTGGRADLAQEAAQYVFTTVAQQAATLRNHRALAGWLYTTTRNAVDNLLRAERRRTHREQEATHMSDSTSVEAAPELNRVRRELDGLMDQLPVHDREAILLRFFHGHGFAQIGATFGLSEDASRKRVDRALERLREKLGRRGITSTSAALSTMLACEAALAAPAGVVKSIAGTALAGGTAPSLPLGLIQLMTTKTPLGSIGALGLASASGISAALPPGLPAQPQG
jgi:RNA polymerase sigma factor (sigma-70 family)